MAKMKKTLLKLLVNILLFPIMSVQRILTFLGFGNFIQGDVFDRLLVNKTAATLNDGRKIVFHTPNFLTRFRAQTLFSKEPETIEWIDGFAADGVLWDIGANVGSYSLYAALRHPALKIFAFEPSIENTYLLNRNIAENSLEGRITAFPFPLSEKSGPDMFRHTKVQLGGAVNSFGVDYSFDGKKADFQVAYKVYGFCADDLESLFQVPQPNYLKIDVDGIEHLIARGARRVLSNTALKSVLIELNFDFPEQRAEIMQIFEECGLQLETYKHADAFYGDGKFSKIYNHIFIRR
jgi:FkbM family methyltransferase